MIWQPINNSSLNEQQIINWQSQLPHGEMVLWQNFTSGPILLTTGERRIICKRLLNIDIEQLPKVVPNILQPYSGIIEKSLILHSTTVEAGAFKGDLNRLKQGKQPKNYTGYVEIRSLYLAKSDDLAVGRMKEWKATAQTMGLEVADIGWLQYYHLSDALLKAAEQHLKSPIAAIEKMIVFLKNNPWTVVRLYGLGKSLQIFLLWLQKMTGLDKIFMDANSLEVAMNWNKKSCLYPPVELALQLHIKKHLLPDKILELEKKHSLLFQELAIQLPTLPGYTLKRSQATLEGFVQQALDAADLLHTRYHLQKGCLKAADSGDGARITPHINLGDETYIAQLATQAYLFGDDYVLESHVDYLETTIGQETLKLSPSAHIRSGRIASGITLQFTKDTFWQGNIFINETLAPQLSINLEEYQTIRQAIKDFLQACQQATSGLVIGGIDFAIGRVGGKFGNKVLLSAQDPNISFNGAEFLRVFMEKAAAARNWKSGTFHALTWVFVPSKDSTFQKITRSLAQSTTEATYDRVIAIVPNAWGMIGIAGLELDKCLERLTQVKLYHN